MKVNWLVLTDHTTHKETNSLYALVHELREDKRCGTVRVCTRGIAENAPLFAGHADAAIHAATLTERFTYASAGEVLQQTEKVDPGTVDVVLLRMPQPVDQAFLLSLPGRFPQSTCINHPRGIRETASKKFLLEVAELCPAVAFVESIHEAVELSHQYEIVLKPLFSYGGKGMFRLSGDWIWREDVRYPVTSLHDVLKELDFPMLSMRFLPRVTEGDKRTIVVNRHIIGSALRTPAPGSWMCNVSYGGTARMDTPDADELQIESILTPILYEKGVVMYGFDTLVNDDGRRVLSEINTSSVGGLLPMEVMSGKPLLKIVAEALYAYHNKLLEGCAF